jgi:hypothetical protein
LKRKQKQLDVESLPEETRHASPVDAAAPAPTAHHLLHNLFLLISESYQTRLNVETPRRRIARQIGDIQGKSAFIIAPARRNGVGTAAGGDIPG